MPYIRRDPDRQHITAFQLGELSSAQRVEGVWSEVAGTEAEVLSFIAQHELGQRPDQYNEAAAAAQLASSDAGLARIAEDLIDILIDRGVIQFIDFPEAAQAKLLQRRMSRQVLQKRLNLLDEPGEDEPLI